MGQRLDSLVIAAALQSGEAARDVITMLSKDDIGADLWPVYDAIGVVMAEGNGTDPSKVLAVIAKAGITAEPTHLLVDLVVLPDYLCSDSSARRSIIRELRHKRIARSVMEKTRGLRLDEAHAELEGLSDVAAMDYSGINDDDIQNFMEFIDENSRKMSFGIPTGIGGVDRIVGGMEPSTVWAIGAPTSGGKTTLLSQAVANAVEKKFAVCLYATLEMDRNRILSRIVGAALGISAKRIYEGRLRDDEKTQVAEMMGVCGAAKLDVVRDAYTLADIVMAARSKRIQCSRLDILVVDFLQNVSIPGIENINERMAEASRQLQALSAELKCCVLIASQLSNDTVREAGSGILSFRYASELGHASDVALEIVPNRKDGQISSTDILIRKNRNGGVGKIAVDLVDQYSRFRERANA